MKKLKIVILLFFTLIFSLSFESKDSVKTNQSTKPFERRKNMKIIPYTDANLTYLGRWVDNNGKYSAWAGSTLIFKFTGTSLALELDGKVISTPGYQTGVLAIIDDMQGLYDGLPSAWTVSKYSAVNGIRTETLITGLEDKEHTAYIRLFHSNVAGRWDGTDYIKIRNVIIDDNATISKWQLGPVKIGYFADSWGGDGDGDTTRFNDRTKFELHSISTGGYSSYEGYTRFDYSIGTTPYTDIPFDAVVIAYGVNDAYGGFPTSTFKNYVSQLIAKVKNKIPNAKIFLVGQPKSPKQGAIDTSMYCGVMQQLADEWSCYFIDMRNANIDWSYGSPHINNADARIYSAYLGEQIASYFPELTPPEPEPINKLSLDDEKISILPLAEVVNNQVQTFIGGQKKCFDLVEPTDVNASHFQIYTKGSIKAAKI